MPTINVAINGRQAQAGANVVNSALGSIVTATRATNIALNATQRHLGALTTGATTASGAMSRFLLALSAGVAVRKAIREYSDFERGLVGVSKTTDLAGDDLRKFGESITSLSRVTPASTKELLDIAQAAGALGVRGTENLLKFTDTVARLNVATDLSGEDAAKRLARILNVTGESAGNVQKLGAAIVALGNNFAATESEIAHVTTYVALASSAFKVTSTDVTALGATLAAMGVRAELAGFAVGRTFRAIDQATREGGDKLELLSKLMGKSGEAITADFQASPIDSFEQFIEALGKTARAGTNVTAVLENLGLQGEENAKVLPTLALRYDQLAKALKFVRQEAANPTALLRESDKAYGTFASKIEILKNNIGILARDVASQFIPAIAKTIDTVTQLTQSTGAIGLVTIAFKSLFIIISLVIALRIVEFFYNASVAVLGLVRAMQKLLVVLIPILTALAAFKFGEYLFNEFRIVQESAAKLIFGFEYLWTSIKTGVKLAVNVALEAFQGLFLWLNTQISNFTSKLTNALVAAGTVVPAIAPLGVLAQGVSANGFPVKDYAKEREKIRQQALNEQFVQTQELGITLANIQNQFGNKDRLGKSFIDSLAEDTQALIDKLQELAAQYSTVDPQAAAQLQALIDSLRAPIDGQNVVKPFDEIGEALDTVSKKAEDVRERIRNVFEDIRLERSLIGKTDDQKDIERQALDLQRLLDKSGYDKSTQAKISADLNRQLGELKEAERLERTFQDIGTTGSQAFEDIAFSVGKASDLIRDLATDLEKIVFKQLFTVPVGNAISGALNGLFNQAPGAAPGKTGANGLVINAASGYVTSQKSYVPMASGGVTFGESGPEVGFLPLERNERGDLSVRASGAGRGGGINIYMNVVTPDVGSFKASSQHIMADTQAKAAAAARRR